MKNQSSAITSPSKAIPTPDESATTTTVDRRGILFGLIGVIAFSFTLPFTRVAVTDLDPLFVGAGRAVVAAVLAGIALAGIRPHRPRGRQRMRVAVVATGVVAGFPLLTSFAMQTAPASHGAVVIGVLPAATAVVAVIRGGERPSRAFWVASIAGLTAVVAFITVSGGGFAGLQPSDLLLLGAVVLAAIGYAEGGLLSRELGSWQTICWALLLAAPVMVVLAAIGGLRMLGAGVDLGTVSPDAWLAFAYVSVISMFLGFFAWYRGLAIGPISSVGQIQLVQPVLTIVWSALIFSERLDLVVVVAAAAVIACAAVAVRARVRA